MATKNYTTKTASLRATKADVRNLDTKKLFIDGVNITDLIKNGQVKILDDRGTLANDELDIWMSNVSTDEDGNVIVREYPQKFEISINDMTETQKSTLKSAVKVENNQVLGANDEHLMFFETNALTSGSSMFISDLNLTSFNSDLSSLTNGSQMFSGCIYLTSFNSDLSSLTDGYHMFPRTKLTTFNSNLSALTSSRNMFQGCTALTTFNSDLSSLTDSRYMFDSCTALTTFNSDLNSITNGERMFYGCTALTTFNSDLNSITNGERMFYGCTALTTFNSDLNNLIECQRMFQGCTALTSFNGDLSSITNGHRMFYNCTALTTFNSDLGSLSSGYYMFEGCTSLTSFDSDLSVLYSGEYMFCNCTALTTFNSDLSRLTNGSGMFDGCKLDASSLANIIHTIKTRTSKDFIKIGLGIDDTDEARQALAVAIWCKDWDEVNQEFSDKNWTVQWQFNGAPTSAATLDMNTTPSPIWAKLEEVVADENGNLPHYSYVSEDGSKYFNLYWYHSSNGNNEGYDYFGSLLEACGYFGITPKEYANEA